MTPAEIDRPPSKDATIFKIAVTAVVSAAVFAATVAVGAPTLTRFIPGPFLFSMTVAVLGLYALAVGCVLAWMNLHAKTGIDPATIRELTVAEHREAA